MGITLTILITALLVRFILTKITWGDEDWRHLRLDDNWDPDQSRGRIKEKKR